LKKHEHSANEAAVHNSEAGIKTAFLLNLIFVFLEVAGGLLTNSVAILSDAIHDLGDCLAIGFAFFMERISKKQPDKYYTYGYRRYSLLSAMITAGILAVGGVLVIIAALRRISDPQAVNAPGMLAIAVLGVIVNGAAVLGTRHGTKLNERAINLHMLEDLLGWSVVLVGSGLIWLFDLPVLDPILSLLVSIYILYHASQNLLSVFRILLEKVPEGFNLEKYRSALMRVEGIRDVHHLHVWSLDDDEIMATLHAVVPDKADASEIFYYKRQLLAASASFGIHHVTIQIDSESEHCSNKSCSPLAAAGHDAHHHHHHH